MKQLFRLLPSVYPLLLPEQELLKFITSKELKVLSKAGILVTGVPLQSAACQTCDALHEVHANSDSKFFYICPEAGKEYVEKDALATWMIQYQHLFESLTQKLNIAADIHEMQKGTLWRLGSVHLDKNSLPVYFSRGKIEDKLLKTTPGIIIIASRAQKSFETENSTKLVCLGDLIADKVGKNIWDKRKWVSALTSMHRRASFESNGDLLVDSKRIVSVKPTSAPFYFLKVLNKHFDNAVSQKNIFSYCEGKLAKLHGLSEWKSEYTEQTFSNKMKQLIKQGASDKKLIDKIIQSTRTSDSSKAYRLTNPD